MIEWRDVKKTYKNRLDELAQLSPGMLLEVPINASIGDIRRAYLAKVKTYHPDSADPFVKAYSQEVLKLVNRAYAALKQEGDGGRE